MSEKEHPHASVATYWKIAAFLAILTFIEVAYPYVTQDLQALNPYYVPVLAVLSAVKFFVVIGLFMHLHFDPKILAGMFAVALIVSSGFMLAFLFLFDIV